jgi:hypothetical protein
MDLVLLGSLESFTATPEQVLDRLREAGAPFPVDDLKLSRQQAEISRIAARTDLPVNRDDRPLLEFRVARGLLRPPHDEKVDQ